MIEHRHGSAFLQSLLLPSAYPHTTGPIRLIETHISWVILTGQFAYKIKKPVNFGFVDYSSLERRRFFCDEEIRLNRRVAPELYLEVVPITGPANRTRIEGEGSPLDYAIRMHQFEQDQLFDALQKNGGLRSAYVDRLATTLAAFHLAAEPADRETPFGRPETILDAVEANFRALLSHADTRSDVEHLHRLLGWTRSRYPLIYALAEERRAQGFVRECHGDLHLGNIVLLSDRPTPFDCIEFNDQLRWIDVVSEIAFLGMDLEVRGEVGLAYRLLNRYQALAGDYAGLRLWTFYRVYRALVRAKVMRLTVRQAENDPDAAASKRDCQRYLDFAQTLTLKATPALILTHGLSGSGKSHLAGRLSERIPAIWLRSDVERKRLSGLASEHPAGTNAHLDLYDRETTRRTYQHLRDLAAILLRSGLSVIVDAAFLCRWQRETQFEVAKNTGARLRILAVETPLPVMRQRLIERQADGKDASDADWSVLNQQLRTRELLTETELQYAIRVDGQMPDIAGLVRQIQTAT